MKLEIRQSTFPTQAKEVKFCTWVNGFATTIGSTLYLAGGAFRESDSAPNNKTVPEIGGKSQIITQDLSRQVEIGDAPLSTIPKPDDIPSLQAGAVWTSNKKIYQFGGQWVQDSQKEALKEMTFSILDVETKKWSVKTLPEDMRRTNGGYTQGGGKGFYYKGGSISRSTPTQQGEKFPSDMLIFDFETETFKTVNGDPEGTKPVTFNTMAYAPFGKNGTIISMGGLTFTGFIQYDKVSVYDIASNTWYQQKTSGERPGERANQCYVHATAPDGSSHQTFVYGGNNNDGANSGYDEIHVLSIPSFTWQKVYGVGPSLARNGAACVRQGANMIVIGGTRQADKEACDFNKERLGMNVFDLSTLSWVSEEPYANNAEYKVADKITRIIGGDKNGNATLLKPVTGWDSPGLESLFSTKTNLAVTVDETVPSNSGSDSSPNTNNNSNGSPSTSSSSSSSSSKAGIIGGAVGGVIGALLLAGLIFFLLRRNRKRPSSTSSISELTGSEPKPLGSSAGRESYKPTPSQLEGSTVGSTVGTTGWNGYNAAELDSRPAASEIGGTERTVLPGDSASQGGFRSELQGSMPDRPLVPPTVPMGFGEGKQTVRPVVSVTDQLNRQKVDRDVIGGGGSYR